jgi:murein DD-endopeptidase MepM/ murein hydrolase activator NlpD
MSFKFATQKLLGGLFEPEGIYLSPPFEGEVPIVQGWGDNADHYGRWRYNSVPLKGHNGVDVLLPAESRLLAMDGGRVIEISMERGGYERYMKVEHRWGESFYANIGEAIVESGQAVKRSQPIALMPALPVGDHIFHFAIRISPFNRYDGWGGFSDPLAYMASGAVIPAKENEFLSLRRSAEVQPHSMADDRPGVRRP